MARPVIAKYKRRQRGRGDAKLRRRLESSPTRRQKKQPGELPRRGPRRSRRKGRNEGGAPKEAYFPKAAFQNEA